MSIRISEPLVSILLSEPIDLANPEHDLNRMVEAAGGTIQAVLVETIACSPWILCPACHADQETNGHGQAVRVSVCHQCGSPYIAFQRSFNGQAERWYSFTPFGE